MSGSVKAPRGARAPLTEPGLAEIAVAYLDRFGASAAHLRRVLGARVTRAARRGEVDEADALRWIDALIVRYRASGLLDDQRFADSVVLGLRARGGSRRKIQQSLSQKGVGSVEIGRALEHAARDSTDAELEAAQAYAKRRRLGPHRKDERERAARRERDLAAMARAGFGFEVARRVLNIARGAADDDDETSPGVGE